MHLHHVAVWTHDIDRLCAFYVDLFGGVAGTRFEDDRRFCSYMVRFSSGCALEMMQMPGVLDRMTPDDDEIHHVGLHHFSFAVTSKEDVRQLTERANALGSKTIKAPHATDDGFFEAMVTDPDGNLVEIAYVTQ